MNLQTIDSDQEWPLFDSNCSISTFERRLVLRLAEDAACALWSDQVSTEQAERHPMLLPMGHWLRSTIPGPNWIIETNAGSDNSVVASFLNQNFALAPTAQVFFILMKERAYLLPINIFIRYWFDFLLLDDEGPFLLHPESGVFACFGPNGQLGIGKRTLWFV